MTGFMHSVPLQVTVMFVYIANLDALSSVSDPLDLVTLLNRLYTMFDSVVESTGVYKVMAASSMYMCVAGALDNNAAHAASMAHTATAILRRLQAHSTSLTLSNIPLEIQVRRRMKLIGILLSIVCTSL
jgi:class 3 adenylate cyclase